MKIVFHHQTYRNLLIFRCFHKYIACQHAADKKKTINRKKGIRDDQKRKLLDKFE